MVKGILRTNKNVLKDWVSKTTKKIWVFLLHSGQKLTNFGKNLKHFKKKKKIEKNDLKSQKCDMSVYYQSNLGLLKAI